jgi:Glycosyl transferase family 90
MKYIILLILISNTINSRGNPKRILFPIEEIIHPKVLKENPIHITNSPLPEWMKRSIEDQFAPFRSGNQKTSDERILSSCVHFHIDGNQLTVDIPDEFLGEFQFPKLSVVSSAIYRLVHAHGSELKKGDFLIHLYDGTDEMQAPCPIFCFSKKKGSTYILIPDWFLLSDEHESHNFRLLKSIFQQKGDVNREVDRGAHKYPWGSKLHTAFWRGGAHGVYLNDNRLWKTNPRASLVLFSLQYPDDVYARFLKNRFWLTCDELKERKSELIAPWMSPADSCQYKYQMDVDGWASGYHRCYWVLRSDCVPLKQESNYVQWYYSGLKPYVHYIPYSADCSDLKEKIEWLRNHDETAHEIACAGQEFVQQNLSHEMIYLYLYEVLKYLTKLH